MIDLLDKYIRLIQKEAWRAYYKLQYNHVSVCDVDDLINEGVEQFIRLSVRYKKRKSKISTILTIVLRNHFTNMLKFETRRVHADIEDVLSIASYKVDYDTKILFKEIDNQLTKPAQEVFRCLLGVDPGYVRWEGRREWARAHLNCRYRTKTTQELLEAYFRRSLLSEFQEIGHMVGWNTSVSHIKSI